MRGIIVTSLALAVWLAATAAWALPTPTRLSTEPIEALKKSEWTLELPDPANLRNEGDEPSVPFQADVVPAEPAKAEPAAR